jgi:hypothetical protein
MDGGRDATLEQRLELLEAERSILATLATYGHAIDYGAREEWLDCFDPLGAFEVRLRGEVKARHDGREALARFIAGHTAMPEACHKHLLVEPRVHLDGGEARVESYFVRLDDDAEGRPVVHGFGRYLDRLARCDDGRWRFLERIAEIEAFDEGGRSGSWVQH